MNEILLFLALGLVVTLAVEMPLALLFKVRGKDLLIVFLANMLTNPAANYGYDWAQVAFAHQTVYLILIAAALEVAVVFIEYLIYRLLLSSCAVGKLKLSLILNGASFVTGLLISFVIRLF